MEKLVLQVICDFCHRKENLNPKQIDSGLLQWRRYEAKGVKYHFCSNPCERKFLEKHLNINLRLVS